MTSGPQSVLDLVEMIRRKAPAYLDLLTAETDAEFEIAFDAVLEAAVTHLERNRVKFSGLDEVGLTAILVAGLSIPGLSVSQETHSNGHVDLTIEADHCSPIRRKLGEAKIYHGPAYHMSGLEQLLGRYGTGREGRGLLIVYFRRASIATLVQGLRDAMDNLRPCKQTELTAAHRLRWSFLSSHEHSCGDDVQVGHVGCNLYAERT